MSDRRESARSNILNAPYDWARWPKLAAIFAERPRINVYWLELADFIASLPPHYAEVSAEEEPGIQHVYGCACHRCTRTPIATHRTDPEATCGWCGGTGRERGHDEQCRECANEANRRPIPVQGTAPAKETP